MEYLPQESVPEDLKHLKVKATQHRAISTKLAQEGYMSGADRAVNLALDYENEFYRLLSLRRESLTRR